jgi:hypothetical protein
MPSTVIDLFNAVDLVLRGTVRWGTRPSSDVPGVYVVTMDSSPDACNSVLSNAPIDEEILDLWINRVPRMSLGGDRPTIHNLKARLNSFWYPDETILYIGKTSARLGIGNRIGQYYNHKLGNKSPHRGGHWLKTLSNLSRLYVHYAETDSPAQKEEILLAEFINNVSETSKRQAPDKDHLIPFSNLEYPKGSYKNHGLRNQVLS